MKVVLEKRAEPSILFSTISPLIALAVTALVGAAIFMSLGVSPIAGLRAYFIAPLEQTWAVHDVLVKAVPLILVGTGLAVCFRSGNWNIGAEGQFLAGCVGGSILPVLLPGWSGWSLLPAMMAFGMIGGALYASIPALLKVRFGANEILTSLMLVYVAQLFADWLVRGAWRDPDGYGFAGTIAFPADARLPQLIGDGPWSGSAHWGVVFALVAAVAVWVMLSRTLKGFEVTVLGSSARAGRFAGFSAGRMTMFSFLLAGALAGLAGIVEVSGNVGKLDDNLSLGYGFTGIIVAFLGRLNPIGIAAAGFLLALTYIGGQEAQITLGISDKVASVFQGLLLVSVLAADTLIRYRVSLKREVRPQAGLAS